MNNLRQIFKESLGLVEAEKKEEPKKPSFCHMLYIDKADEDWLLDLQHDNNLEGELVESGTFHCTVRYIKTEQDPQKFVDWLKTTKLPTLSGTCKNFEVYGVKKDTLVIELEGKELHDYFKKINEWLTENGYPQSDFPTYKPHISLTEKADIEKPKWKKEYERKVTFKTHVVTDTAHEDIMRKKAE